MRTPAQQTLIVLLLVTGAGCAKNSGLVDKAAPRGASTAFSYFEQTEIGKGRELESGRLDIAALDINSRVSLRVEVAEFRVALASSGVPATSDAELRELGDRIAALSAAATGIGQITKLAEAAVEAWRDSGQNGNYTAFDAHLKKFAEAIRLAVFSLRDAMAHRLTEEGHAPADAKHLADLLFEPAMTGHGLVYGYNWPMVSQLNAKEIERLQRRIEQLPADMGLKLAVRAYRVGRIGPPVPIPLDRYNTEAEGPRMQYAKLRFEASEDQLQLYARYETLAQRIGDTKSEAEAFRSALKAEFSLLRGELEPAFSAAAAALDSSAKHARTFKAWADTSALKSWVGLVRSRVEEIKGDGRAHMALDSLDQSLRELSDDMVALRVLAELQGGLGQAMPDQAMARIATALGGVAPAASRALNVEHWNRRARLIRRLAEMTTELDDQALLKSLGLREAADAMEIAARAVSGADHAVSTWLQRLALMPAASTAAVLPVPQGERHLPIAGNLDTSFDLQTIPGGIAEGDRIRIDYEVLRDGKPSGVAWSDSFITRAFGWRSRLVAGLAFSRRDGENAWIPTPSLSWLASYRRWPDSFKSGLGQPFYSGIGLGFSTMALDFDPAQAVELGLAATISFLDHRLLAGYGVNLQAGDPRWFGFFSIRIFSSGGELGVQ